MEEGTSCPVCFSNGLSNNLVLKQINFTSAVYLCEDKNCSYPEGHEWIEVPRNLEDLAAGPNNMTTNQTTMRDSNEDDLDKWLNTVFDTQYGDTCTSNTNEFNNIQDDAKKINISNGSTVIQEKHPRTRRWCKKRKTTTTESANVLDTVTCDNLDSISNSEEINSKIVNSRMEENGSESIKKLNKAENENNLKSISELCKLKEKISTEQLNDDNLKQTIIISNSKETDDVCKKVVESLHQTSILEKSPLKIEKTITNVNELPDNIQQFFKATKLNGRRNKAINLIMVKMKPVNVVSPQVQKPPQRYTEQQRKALSNLKMISTVKPSVKSKCHVVDKKINEEKKVTLTNGKGKFEGCVFQSINIKSQINK